MKAHAATNRAPVTSAVGVVQAAVLRPRLGTGMRPVVTAPTAVPRKKGASRDELANRAPVSRLLAGWMAS